MQLTKNIKVLLFLMGMTSKVIYSLPIKVFFKLQNKWVVIGGYPIFDIIIVFTLLCKWSITGQSSLYRSLYPNSLR
jgi:hypothetical protein